MAGRQGAPSAAACVAQLRWLAATAPVTALRVEGAMPSLIAVIAALNPVLREVTVTHSATSLDEMACSPHDVAVLASQGERSRLQLLLN